MPPVLSPSSLLAATSLLALLLPRRLGAVALRR